ncbi:hypothetical protein DPMN_118343 [Dreissena polymorpha]|uniref:Uncharacterized protein n=1 Tax=Dreissena polymorpha TaxID=45954 RepID=A0A9D4GGR5_DREPO|nr:hypothetical protein DPMN_118343 [Dreissena polymorpha]
MNIATTVQHVYSSQSRKLSNWLLLLGCVQQPVKGSGQTGCSHQVVYSSKSRELVKLAALVRLCTAASQGKWSNWLLTSGCVQQPVKGSGQTGCSCQVVFSSPSRELVKLAAHVRLCTGASQGKWSNWLLMSGCVQQPVKGSGQTGCSHQVVYSSQSREVVKLAAHVRLCSAASQGKWSNWLLTSGCV